MKGIIRKLILASAQVTDCCAGRFSVADECMLLPQHPWLGECDSDSKSVTSILLYLAVIFVRQVLDKILKIP